MKTINDRIKNALKQPTTQRKGRILVDGNYYEVYNVEYYADAYADGNVIGNAIASQLDFDLPYMSKFDSFKYFDGVWTGSEYEYIDLGTFNVFDEKDEDEFNKHITAFDNLIKFNAPFEDKQDYPKTIFTELQNICNQAGIELINDNIVNGNFMIENNQFVNGENLKSVLKAICQISGTYAVIKDDKLKLHLTNKTNESITKSEHEPVTWKRRTYGINQLILGMQDVEGEYVIREDLEDIAINGVHKLVINDNPFAYTQDKRDVLIDELFNQVKGFGYIPYEVNMEWLSYLEIGDTIKIDNNDTLILRISGKSPKSLESSILAPAIIDSAINYANNTSDIKNILRRTEIKVDKSAQTIDATVETITNQGNSITNLQVADGSIQASIKDVNDNVEQLRQTIEGLENNVTTVGGGNLIKDSLGALNDGSWEGNVATIRDTYALSNSIAGQGIMLNNGIIEQQIQLPNAVHTLSFNYKKRLTTINAKLYIDENVYELDSIETKLFEEQINVTNNSLNIKFECDTDNGCYILDLMLNLGEVKETWSQNANETITDTVKIGKGVQVESSKMNTYFRADADGTRVINKTTGEIVREDTDKGTNTNEFISRSTSIVNGVLFARVGNQRWISGV